MSGALEYIEELAAPERRTYTRHPMRTLTYVELDEGNGGIVLNFSEGGFSVQAVTSLMDDALPKVRFQLSQSREWLEASARVVWANDSRKVAGLEFIDLPDAGRKLIREWLAGESTAEEPGQAADAVHDEAAAIPEPSAAVAERPLTEASAQTPASPLSLPSLGQPAGQPSLVTEDLFAESAPTHEARSERAWNLAGLIAVLAVVSLAAGWVAGRGTFESLWENLHRATPTTKAAQANTTAADSATLGPPISQIETVDLYNQRWTIPLNLTPGSPPTASHSQQQPAPSPWPAYNPALATPQIGARAAQDGSAGQPSAPAVAGPSDGGVSISFDQPVDPSQIAPPPETSAARPASVLQRGVLIYHVNPIYPELAREQDVQGTVQLEVTIGTDGVVRSVIALSGPGLLIEAARSAVRRWRYTPTLLNGKPIESQTTVSVVFHMQSAPP